MRSKASRRRQCRIRRRRDRVHVYARDQEYIAEYDATVLGSVTVTSAHLRHGIYELPSTWSNPEIVAYRAWFNRFSEARP
jgi:hypothetical protein